MESLKRGLTAHSKLVDRWRYEEQIFHEPEGC